MDPSSTPAIFCRCFEDRLGSICLSRRDRNAAPSCRGRQSLCVSSEKAKDMWATPRTRKQRTHAFQTNSTACQLSFFSPRARTDAMFLPTAKLSLSISATNDSNIGQLLARGVIVRPFSSACSEMSRSIRDVELRIAYTCYMHSASWDFRARISNVKGALTWREPTMSIDCRIAESIQRVRGPHQSPRKRRLRHLQYCTCRVAVLLASLAILRRKRPKVPRI